MKMKEHKNHKGYSLVEMLVVLGISSILLVVLALLFKTGIWEVGRSSGRIELVRTGRQALNQIQRYMASANAPGGLTFDGEAVKSAVYTPLDSEIYDPTKTNNPDPADRVRFFSSVDFLSGVAPLKARDLQRNPIYRAYEITAIPTPGQPGQSIVLRRLLDQPATAGTPFPLDVDTSVNPRFLAHRLGIPDVTAPSGYRDGLVVRKLNRESAIQIEVHLSSDLVSDDLNRSQLENHTPLRIRMQTIYQPPFYNLDRI